MRDCATWGRRNTFRAIGKAAPLFFDAPEGRLEAKDRPGNDRPARQLLGDTPTRGTLRLMSKANDRSDEAEVLSDERLA